MRDTKGTPDVSDWMIELIMRKNPFLQSEFDASRITRIGKVADLVEAVREKVTLTTGGLVDLNSVRSTVAFRNLVWAIRNTPKHDAHCHVSGTLDDEFLASRGLPGTIRIAGSEALRISQKLSNAHCSIT